MANANSDGIIIPNYVNNAQVVQTRWENLLSSVATQPTTGGGDAIRRAAYDTSRLSKVGTDPEAARQQQQQQQEEQQEQQLQRQSDIDQQNANNDVSGAEGKEDDSGFILTMVLNIVPTGVRITNKLPVLVEGMKNVALSIIDMISNLSILSIILFADTFTFVTQSFYFIFTMLLCMVFNLTNLHKCIVFYLFDLFLLVIFMSVMSALFMIDVFFGTKTYIGVSCVEALMMIIGSFGDIDAAIYGFTGVHIFSYPDFILNLCYRCEMAGDLSGFYRASGKMGYDLGVLVPTSIGGPIGEFIGGIIDMVSIFSING